MFRIPLFDYIYLDEFHREGIREILASFEARIEGWMTRYREVKAVFEREGNLKIPVKGNKSLLQWLEWQRVAFRTGNLSPEKAALLSKMGMIWDNSNDSRWHAHFLRVRDLIDEYGCLPPPDKMGKFLKNWLASQKVKYRQNKLKKEYSELLEQIVSLKDTRIGLWTSRLERLEKYFEKYKRFPTSKGTGIHRDVFNTRASKKAGTLPKFVEERLEELGFKFGSRQRSFAKGLEILVRSVSENKGQLPTRKTNPCLYWWYMDKCAKYRRGLLKKEEIDLFRMHEAAAGIKLLPTLVVPSTVQSRRARCRRPS